MLLLLLLLLLLDAAMGPPRGPAGHWLAAALGCARRRCSRSCADLRECEGILTALNMELTSATGCKRS